MRTNVLLGIAVVAAALFLGNLGRAPLLDPPGGIHAEIAREMLERGNWITPRLDGVLYFDKPALLYWLLAASFAALGIGEWSAAPTAPDHMARKLRVPLDPGAILC